MISESELDIFLVALAEELLVLTGRHLPGVHDQSTHGHGGGFGGVGTKDDPVRTNDVIWAQKSLAEGKYVSLQREREVSTFLDRLKADVDDARATGRKAAVYDLCKVSVPGTNLFCQQSAGIPRAQMPQLKGKPLPGSKADKMAKDAKGEVDLSGAFAEHLVSKGYAVHDERIDAKYLKASQNELEGNKVVGIAGAMREGRVGEAPIFVSKDDYIVDGHHRWAAVVANEYIEGQPLSMPVRVIDAPILDVLREANDYALGMGIPGASIGVEGRARADCATCGRTFAEIEAEAERHLPGQHDQMSHGHGGGSYAHIAHMAQEGGFTISRHDGAPAHGFMVSPYKGSERKYTVDEFRPEHVQAFREANKELLAKPEHYLGGWRDGNDIYLDISVHRGTPAEAKRVAVESDQLAVYDLDHGTSINTPDLPDRASGAYAESLFEAGTA